MREIRQSVDLTKPIHVWPTPEVCKRKTRIDRGPKKLTIIGVRVATNGRGRWQAGFQNTSQECRDLKPSAGLSIWV